MWIKVRTFTAIAVLSTAGASFGDTQSFHLLQIEQVIGGVNGDTSVQAIQLRVRFPGESQLSFARLRAYDAAGLNPVTVCDFGTDIGNSGVGSRVLIVSAGFAANVTPALSADFTMTNVIPASYLSAGRITYESDDGTVYWSLSFGGAGYTGPTTGAPFNDADGEFGPPFDGPLPSDGLQGLRFNGLATDPSVSNAGDYTLTTGSAVFANNNGAVFFLELPSGIPTVSGWGLIVTILLFLTAATVVSQRRTPHRTLRPTCR